MKYLQLYIDAFKQILNFKGKSDRTAFWSFVVITAIVTFVLLPIVPAIAWIYGVAELIAYVMLCIRRGHDIGNPLWAILGVFVPVGTIILGLIPRK